MFIIEILTQRGLKDKQLAIDSVAQSLGSVYDLQVPKIIVTKLSAEHQKGFTVGTCTRVDDHYEIQLEKSGNVEESVYAHEVAHALLFHNNPTFQLDRRTENSDRVFDEARKGDTDEAVSHLKRLTVEDFYGEAIAGFIGNTRGGKFLTEMDGISKLINNKIAEWAEQLGGLEESLEGKSKKERGTIFLEKIEEQLKTTYKLAYDTGMFLGVFMANNREKIGSEKNLFLHDAVGFLSMCMDVCNISQGDDEVFTNEFFKRLNELETVEE